MRVLIIPENPHLDRHILVPVVKRVLADVGRPHARVDVLTDPHLTSATQALDQTVVADIVADNAMVDVFVLAVDRDCDRARHEAKLAARVAEHEGRMVGVLAHQELEVWALALHHRSLDDPWQTVRDDCDPKERYWDPFVAQSGWLSAVGKGRKKAMRHLGAGWEGLLRRCPEVVCLRNQLNALVTPQP